MRAQLQNDGVRVVPQEPLGEDPSLLSRQARCLPLGEGGVAWRKFLSETVSSNSPVGEDCLWRSCRAQAARGWGPSPR